MIDWNPVLVNITAPGGLGIVLATGVFAWRKLKRVAPSEQEAENAVEKATAPKEEKRSDTLAHDLVEMMAQMRRDLTTERNLGRHRDEELRAERERGRHRDEELRAERERGRHRDEALTELRRRLEIVSYSDGVRRVWISDLLANWPIHRQRKDPPPAPNVEIPREAL